VTHTHKHQRLCRFSKVSNTQISVVYNKYCLKVKCVIWWWRPLISNFEYL